MTDFLAEERDKADDNARLPILGGSVADRLHPSRGEHGRNRASVLGSISAADDRYALAYPD